MVGREGERFGLLISILEKAKFKFNLTIAGSKREDFKNNFIIKYKLRHKIK